MPGLVCNACNTHFPDEATQKAHYRSEWHRYNLRRKVAGVPGVTETLFNLRLESVAAESKKQEKATPMLYKSDACNKEYRSLKAHSQHLRSKLHIQKSTNLVGLSAQNLTVCPAQNRNGTAKPASLLESLRRGGQANQDSSDEWEEIDDDVLSYETQGGSNEYEENKIALPEEDISIWDASQCFFCDDIPDGSIEGCADHMHKQHGFFIPDVEFLKDPSGLLSYLALKVTKDFMCLFCDDHGKQFQSLEAVRKHMISKNHCKLRYGDNAAEEELGDFYDFSSSYMHDESSQIIAVDDTAPLFLNENSELVVRREVGNKTSIRVLGCRDFAKYYKQRPSPSLVTRYWSMGLITREGPGQVTSLKETRKLPYVRADDMRTRLGIKNNIIKNLPRNVTY